MTDEDETEAGVAVADGSDSEATTTPVTGADEDPDEGDDWRFSVDEVGDDEPPAEGADADADGDGDGDGDGASEAGANGEDGNVTGSLLDLEDELEPGTPSIEGTMFVLLGAFATVLFLLEAGGVL